MRAGLRRPETIFVSWRAMMILIILFSACTFSKRMVLILGHRMLRIPGFPIYLFWPPTPQNVQPIAILFMAWSRLLQRGIIIPIVSGLEPRFAPICGAMSRPANPDEPLLWPIGTRRFLTCRMVFMERCGLPHLSLPVLLPLI